MRHDSVLLNHICNNNGIQSYANLYEQVHLENTDNTQSIIILNNLKRKICPRPETGNSLSTWIAKYILMNNKAGL